MSSPICMSAINISVCTFVVIQSLSRIQLLCLLRDCSPPRSSVLEISQARILEWFAISFSRGIFPTQGSNPRHCLGIVRESSQPRDQTQDIAIALAGRLFTTEPPGKLNMFNKGKFIVNVCLRLRAGVRDFSE